jgi:hypothetical protein
MQGGEWARGEGSLGASPFLEKNPSYFLGVFYCQHKDEDLSRKVRHTTKHAAWQSKVRCAAPAKKNAQPRRKCFFMGICEGKSTKCHEVTKQCPDKRGTAAAILMRSWHGYDSWHITAGFAAAMFWRMRSCNGIGGNVLKLASTHGPMSDLDEVIRNAVALRMLSFLQDLLDCDTRGAQRAARERVKCTVLLHCIRICSLSRVIHRIKSEHLLSSPL